METVEITAVCTDSMQYIQYHFLIYQVIIASRTLQYCLWWVGYLPNKDFQEPEDLLWLASSLAQGVTRTPDSYHFNIFQLIDDQALFPALTRCGHGGSRLGVVSGMPGAVVVLLWSGCGQGGSTACWYFVSIEINWIYVCVCLKFNIVYIYTIYIYVFLDSRFISMSLL